MKRAYAVVGEHPERETVEDYYAICHSMDRAEELCAEAYQNNPNLVYTWYEVIEEDDE